MRVLTCWHIEITWCFPVSFVYDRRRGSGGDLISDSNVRARELQQQRREIEIEESLELVIAVHESDFEFDVIDETELFGFVRIRHDSCLSLGWGSI